jgi:hypothetical protein
MFIVKLRGVRINSFSIKVVALPPAPSPNAIWETSLIICLERGR